VKFEFASDAGTGENGEPFDVAGATSLGNSPVDGSPVYDVGSAYASLSALEHAKTGLRISKVMLGKTLTHEDISKMLNGETTDLIKGFVSLRTHRRFDAKLKLGKTGKIEFEFPPREAGKLTKKKSPH
jgi:DNA topoisomerase-3